MLVEGAKWRFENVRGGFYKRFLWLHGAYLSIYLGFLAYVYYALFSAMKGVTSTP